MAQPHSGKSPRARARQSLRSAYRARGHRNANLWLVHSLKTDRDWLIGSDRSLVHWLHYLEADPRVATFIVDPSQEEIRTFGIDGIDAAAAVARTHDGCLEVHRIYESTRAADADAAEGLTGVQLVKISATPDLHSCGRHAFRWLNALGYANAIGKDSHHAAFVAVGVVVKQKECGSVGEVIDSLELHSPSIVIGVLVHLAISGSITLDLGSGSVARSTTWSLREHEQAAP